MEQSKARFPKTFSLDSAENDRLQQAIQNTPDKKLITVIRTGIEVCLRGEFKALGQLHNKVKK